jgi:hypothetical protein
MANISHPITIDELNDNYEFKVVRKAVMKEFPWIKDAFVDPANLEKYNLIFVDFDIDPVKLGEEMGWELTPWVQMSIDKGLQYKGMYLSLFFQDVKYEDSIDISNDITELMNSVGKSPAFPKDLRLKGDRPFAIGDYFLNKGSDPW